MSPKAFDFQGMVPKEAQNWALSVKVDSPLCCPCACSSASRLLVNNAGQSSK